MVVRSRGAARAGRPCQWRAEAAASLCVPWTPCGPSPCPSPRSCPWRGEAAQCRSEACLLMGTDHLGDGAWDTRLHVDCWPLS